MCESLVVVVLMQPDAVLDYDRDNFQIIIQNRSQETIYLEKSIICERN